MSARKAWLPKARLYPAVCCAVGIWREIYRPTDWQFHTVILRKVRTTTGDWVSGEVMRRRRGGKWEYRKLTEEEKLVWQDGKAY